MEMIKPKITYEENTEKGNYAKFVIEPLERGYGTTLETASEDFCCRHCRALHLLVFRLPA